MRNLIIVISVLTFMSCKTQMNVYPIGTGIEAIDQDQTYYVKDVDNYHDAIVGIWKWGNTNESFEVVIQEFEMVETAPQWGEYRDYLFGTYKYSQNGTVVSESTVFGLFPTGNLTLMFKDQREYYIQIKDIVSLKSRQGKFKLINANTATWELWISEGLKMNLPQTDIDFTLPTNIFLTKE